MKPVLIGALIALGFVAYSPAAEVRRDVVYGEAEGQKLLLDVSVPEGKGPFPVVILVHGGGWSSGDKAGAEKPGSGADITPWFAPLTEAGFAWVSINYRLAPANRWPACLEDTRMAANWVRAHAPEFGGDPNRLALMGHSAGGHLALLAALPGEDGRPSPVQAVVGCAPVSDFVADTERRGGLSRSLQDLLMLPAAMTPEAVERLRTLSPITRLAAGYPPTLLLHGEIDKTVPLAQSSAFQARAHALGLECELHVLPGAPHRLTEWTAHDPDWARVLTDWLKARLGPPVEAAPLQGSTTPASPGVAAR
jgi:alpha-L-fucosidase 2